MSAPMDCSTLMELAPELVVDSLDGELRAEALAHLATCPSCRIEVTELADTADALTLLAPSEEPPPGFVDRVLDAMTPPAPAPVPIESKRRRWRTGHVIAAIAAAVALAVAGTVAVEQHDHGGSGVALNARTLRTIHMIGMDKSSVGDAYVSTGSNPWLLVSLDYGFNQRAYRLVGVQADGTVVDVGAMRPVDGQWAWAGRFPSAGTLVELRVVDGTGALVCRGMLPTTTA
jgi:anti-sigma factor RsiW